MKHLFLSLLACMALSANAQNQWGVIGGVNMSTSSAENMKWKVGGYVEALYDIRLSDSWYLQPQLIYSYEENETKAVQGFSDFCSQHALTLPVLASYKVGLGDNDALRISAGPYLQYAMFGRYRSIVIDDKENARQSLEWWHSSFGDRFTYGIKGGIGYEHGHFMLNADCKYSLRKSFLNNDGHGLSLSVGVGYKF